MAKIRPIDASDLRNTYGEVKQPTTSNTLLSVDSAVSKKLFGDPDAESKGYFENVEVYNKRAFITLSIPVLNFFLAGENAELLSNILQKDVAAIAQGQIVYDIKEQKEIEVSNIDKSKIYTSDILIGGTYLRYLMTILDVDQELLGVAKSIVNTAFKKCGIRKPDIDAMGRFTTSGGVEVIDGIFYQPTVAVELDLFKSIVRSLVVDDMSNYNSRLTLLLSIRKDKSAILNQVMEYLIVLPIGYRPNFKKKKDKLTKAYDNIVRINNELTNMMMRAGVRLEVVRTCYLDLVNAVKHLTIKNQSRYDEQYKSLLDLIKGKKGIIRDKMQGVRVDYSGRSVIIVDPDMSVDTIGIPLAMAERVMELDILKNYKTNSTNKSQILSFSNERLRKDMAKRLMEGTYGVTGRQPTLYQLGLRGFKVKVVDGNAIVLNPLSTPAFNADFDGDQMHFETAVSQKAKDEVRILMDSVSNIFLPRSGESHIAPRQEIIHGLYRAYIGTSRNGEGKTVTITDEDEFIQDICDQKVNIYDKVSYLGRVEPAGRAAIRCCLPLEWRKCKLGVIPIQFLDSVKEKPVTEKFFKELLKEIGMKDKQQFIDTTNKLVRLGFKVANIFPPSIPVLNRPDVNDLIDEFDAKIRSREEYYNLGFETERSFTLFYNDAYSELESKIKKRLTEAMGDDNGFIQMIKSGARGNMSNLMQMFGMKGRVMKNEAEAFNAIIKHSFAEQLTGLEHFVTAYGGRQGLIDKSIQTYAPGYLSRKMSHTTSGMSIVSDDCGTEDGLLLDYMFLRQFIKQDMLLTNEVANNKYVKDFTVKILEGRYIVGRDKIIGTKREAEAIYDAYIAQMKDEDTLDIKTGLKLRSPITCKNPCCAKCYGRDLGTNARAVKGLPVGFIASQSIGEPGTQLTMKNFQSGGVAGVTNLTSSFDVMETYIHLYNMRKANEPLTYDFIAPVEGYCETISRGDGTKTLYIKNYDKKGKYRNLLTTKVILYEDIELKEYVKVGESIQKVQGDLSIHEILKFRGAEYAQRYLTLMLFNIFQREVFVSMKHFEVLVATMTFKLCVKGNQYFKPGLFYTLQEYYAHNTEGCDFYTTLKGVKEVPLYRNDFFSTIFMENIQKGAKRSIITSGQDEMKLPIVRYSFGLPIKMGSAVSGYLETRGKLRDV